MALQFEVQETPKAPTFPLLRQSASTGMILMFTAANTGFVLHLGKSSEYELGEKSTGWSDHTDKCWKKIDSLTITSQE